MPKSLTLPKQLFVKPRLCDGDRSIDWDTRETADEFDEEGIVGRYELVETGKITIENSFVSHAIRERNRGMGGQDDRERTRRGAERRGGG